MIEIIKGNVPSKSNSYRIIRIGNHSSLGKTAKLRAYEKTFYMQCRKYKGLDLKGELSFVCDVYYNSKRPDLDGCTKVILDCLQKVKAFKNDNKIVDIRLRKFKDVKNPRIEFSIDPIEWDYSKKKEPLSSLF